MLYAKLTGVTSIAVFACPPFLVAVKAPVHVDAVDHLDRSFRSPREAVTDRAFDLILNVDPVRKDNMLRKLVHLLPGDLFARFHILDHFQCLRPFADRIR